ncbi:MAG TPA: NAD-dependent DNA ligase LigA [Opitutaceae bacterium]|nr:NAD-dependent DNA ligase LigA [Opitutaceae bacterium]
MLAVMNGRHALGRRPGWSHTVVLALLLLLASALPAEMPSNDPARDRIAALRVEIAHHDELYFRHAAPEISDAAYDALKRELAALEREHPAEAAAAGALAALADDHTDGFARMPHRTPMLGLLKSYTEAELRAWYEGAAARTADATLGVVIEPKIDGVAFSASYERGELVRVLTRGNGGSGDDVTNVARQIRSLPARLAARASDGRVNMIPELIELRGEVYVSWAEFARLNREREAEGEEPYAHPRNLAAGTLKQLAPEESQVRALDVVFYNWGAYEPTAAAPESQRAFHEQARRWALPVIEHVRAATNAETLWRAVQALGAERRSLPYPIDGAVAKVDAVALRGRLGESDAAPRWAMAYKFTAERATTRLRTITIQVGRTGRLTPVAELEPVALAGSTVARASLHNPASIGRLDLRIGDHVVLEKSGEIIPQLVEVDRTQRPAESTSYLFPENCPECGTPVLFSDGRTEARCVNEFCAAKVRGRIEHFAECIEIKGLGPATVATLVASGLVRDAGDLYLLRRKQLVALPGIGDKRAAALLAAIEQSRQAELWRVIAGLGIPRVGPVAAKELAIKYRGIRQLIAAPELEAWLGRAENRELCARLADVRGE